MLMIVLTVIMVTSFTIINTIFDYKIFTNPDVCGISEMKLTYEKFALLKLGNSPRSIT